MIDHILYNGVITTLNPEQPRVSALAISYGRIVALGSDDAIVPLATRHTVLHNLNGRYVLPGLTDAHIHWEWTARALRSVDLFEVPSKAEALTRIAARVPLTSPDSWITGRGWAQDLWKDRQFPSAADLDGVAPTHPCYFAAKSGHAAWVNTAALRVCGINANTPDPQGGHIMRDAHGEPTGILLENAMGLVARQIPDPTSDQLADDMRHAQDLALASGLTGLHDFDDPSCLRALQVLRERDQLSLRVVKQINKAWLDSTLMAGIRWNFGDDWLRFGALKLFADGALGPRTAAMVAAYEGEPDNYGIIVTDKEEMQHLISRASAMGLPSTVHAIGDRAVHDVLDVLEAVRSEESQRGETPAQRRHRIEHVQIIHPDDKYRLAQLKIIASMQPIHATSDWETAERYWGKRNAWSYQWRWQQDQGVVLAFGSDSPVEPFEPLKGIYAAVTRQDARGLPVGGWYPEYRLTMDETLRAFTTGAAYAAGMEDRLGMLKVGYLADLIVLDRDLYRVSPDEIPSTQILGTMVGGIWRYRAE